MVRENNFDKIGIREAGMRKQSSDEVISSQLEELKLGERDPEKNAKEEGAFGSWTVGGLRKFLAGMQHTLQLREDFFEKVGDLDNKTKVTAVSSRLVDLSRQLYEIEDAKVPPDIDIITEIQSLYNGIGF